MEHLDLTLLIFAGFVLILLIPIPFIVVIAIIKKLWN